MHVNPTVFALPKDMAQETINATLTGDIGLRFLDRQTITRHYLDSFDWRLFNQGYILEADELNDGVRLNRRSHPTGDSQSLLLPKLPTRSADLRAGEIRDWLNKLLGLRSLISMAQTRCHVVRYALRNQEEKIIARVEYQRDRIGRSKDLGQRLVLLPLRGYENQAQTLAETIRNSIKVHKEKTDPFFLAIAASDRSPGDYAQKPNFILNPWQRADTTSREILSLLLETIECNKPGTIAELDTEFLHDLRIAVRRSRSLLSQMKKTFPEQRVERFSRDLAWLGGITSPARDMDVYLLDFETLRQDLPKSMRPDLEPFWEFLQRHHSEAYAQLGTDLSSAKYSGFIRDWEKFLAAPSPKVSSQDNAMRPVKQVADERIWKLYKKAIGEGQAIDKHSPNEALHDLRKTCKKLRYMMEFFRNLYPPEEIAGNIKALKRLQDFLGDFQDLEVQSHKLHEFATQMGEEELLPEATEQAMNLLADHLDARQVKIRGKFSKLFQHFARKDNRKHFAGLFKS